MWERVKPWIRVIYLLPLAVLICWGKQLRARNSWAMLFVCLIPMVLIVAELCFIMAKPASAAAGEEVETSSPTAAVTDAPALTETEESDPVSITLSFAGDCTLGMDTAFDYPSTLNAMFDSEGAAYFFQNVRDIFASDDLTVVNLEGVLSTALERADKDWAFKGDLEYVDILTAGSVEAVNLANNHSSDYGAQSLGDTKQALDGAGIQHFGFQDTVVTEVNGIKVGLLGMYTVYASDGYQAQLESLIQDLQNQGAQVIVASFHWGLENDSTPEEDQIQLAHAAIDAGAHLVIGHHPHILQGIEQYKGRYIVYSLGNFCFGGNYDPPDYDCMIFQQTFTVDEDGPAVNDDVNIIPCSISARTDRNDYRPTPAEGAEADRIIQKIEALSDGLS